jgi:DNA polymerase IV
MDLRWLFLDMNSFFASCEQQENPELRGRPIAVAPVESDSTCCIAASYEARAYGIRCGTNIGVARRACPDLVVIYGRHTVYAEYHRQIMRLLRLMLPQVRKLSVDEIACPLGANELSPGDAVRLALRIKHALYEHVGECMTCSVGLAPNAFLAKVATKLHKPNGLVVIRKSDLPTALLRLDLSDFPGIGRRMLPRLYRCGIRSVADLYAADPWLLRLAWGGVVGERWWFMLRGSTDCDYGALTEVDTKSIGHSHVLAPALRNQAGAEGVLLRLTARAVRRLRLKGFHARAVTVSVRHSGESRGDVSSWSGASDHRTPAADPFTLVAAARELWRSAPDYVRQGTPIQVGVTFSNLVRSESVTLPMFHDERRNEEAALAMDRIRERFGKEAIDLGSVFFQREGSREAIAFAKVTDDDRDKLDQSPFEIRKGVSGPSDIARRALLRT